jgi:hypothetical protein
VLIHIRRILDEFPNAICNRSHANTPRPFAGISLEKQLLQVASATAAVA